MGDELARQGQERGKAMTLAKRLAAWFRNDAERPGTPKVVAATLRSVASDFEEGELDDILGAPSPTFEDVACEAKRVFGEQAYVTDPYDYFEAWPSQEDWYKNTAVPMIRTPTLDALYHALRALPTKKSL